MNMPHDLRFTDPLYTIGEAARFLGVPPSTMTRWVGSKNSGRGKGVASAAPVVTAYPAHGTYPRIPFIGLAEAMVVASFRRTGVSLQHIRKTLDVLYGELGIEHVLASRRLYTDGSTILYDYAHSHIDDMAELTAVVTGQRVFADIVREYLDRITYGSDGWAENLVLPLTERRLLRVDPARAFGQPFFVHGAAPLQDVVDRFIAGDPLDEVAHDFGVPRDELEDVVRAILRLAA